MYVLLDDLIFPFPSFYVLIYVYVLLHNNFMMNSDSHDELVLLLVIKAAFFALP